MPKHPLDTFPYEPDPNSRPIELGVSDGCYVFVRDAAGTIFILAEGAHRHPKVLGRAAPAEFAGDLTVLDGRIQDVTNLSGTFQFDDPQGLLEVAAELERLGFVLLPDAVRFFPLDGSRPTVLR